MPFFETQQIVILQNEKRKGEISDCSSSVESHEVHGRFSRDI